MFVTKDKIGLRVVWVDGNLFLIENHSAIWQFKRISYGTTLNHPQPSESKFD